MVKVLQTGAQDSSIYVRKAIPLGLIKLSKLDPGMLGDKETGY